LGRKRYAEAAAAFRRTLLLARQAKLDSLEVNALGSLGNVAMGQEHYDEAIDWYKIALARSQALGTHFSEALALGNMGWNYQAVGDFENAETVLKQAEKTSADAGRAGNQVYWLTMLGDVYYQERRFADAESVSKRALSLAQSMDDKATVTYCLNTLSEIALATGMLDQAEKYNAEALHIEQAGLDQSGIALSKIVDARISAAKRQYQDAEKKLQSIVSDQTMETDLRWQAEARLARVYADEGLEAEAETQFRAALATIETARTGVQTDEFRVSFLASAIEFYDDYITFLVGQNRMLEALRAADLARARTLEDGLQSASKVASHPLNPLPPHQLATRLKSTLLFYWLGEKQSHLWVITSAAVTHLALPPAEQIEPLLKLYHEALFQSRDPLETGNADAQKLYSMLVQPAEKFIPKGSRVIVLPDGSLYGLNFEALIVPGPQPHYWIEDVTLTTANSLTLLASATARVAPRDKTLFLVGNTVSPSADFPVLPQAAEEMQDVEKYFPQAHRAVLTGAAGTPTAYLSSQPERFSYMHFVTHGTASRTRPLESAVILSKEKDADSFKLYARDIVKHHLSAYLVVISACNGAGTRAYSGEGLVGLSWAFLRAGAHNVIGALWEVSDSSTPQLMDELYDGLSHGEDPATALRAAKLSLLHSGTVYKKPFYWAPFQLYAGS
jgi:CHAT domain-containing protein